MNVRNRKQALLASAVMLALGAGAIGTGVVVAQERGAENAVELRGRDAGLHKVDLRGGRGAHHDGFGGRHGGELMMGLFDEVDADGDGAVTQAEIDTYRDARVGAVDASGDGALDIDEFDTLYRELTRSRVVDAFQRLDEDGDGAITSEELDVRFGSIVERLDRNDDGALSVEDRGRRQRS